MRRAAIWTWLIVAAATVCAERVRASPPVSFVQGPTTVFGTNSNSSYNLISIVVGDFNGDGKPDVAVGNPAGGVVSILLGRGDGTFAAATNLATGPGVSIYGMPNLPIDVADFNGDGIPDLAVANMQPNYSLSAFVGRGDGTFFAPANYAIRGAAAVSAGSTNRISRLIAAVIPGYMGTFGTISLIEDYGIGMGIVITNYTVPVGLYAVTTGDFNGDGRPDVAAAGLHLNGPSPSNVVVFLSRSTPASFTTNILSTAPYAFQQIQTVDLNHDGKSDLVLGGTGVQVMLGNGDGTFTAGTTYPVSSGALVLGDFNGDGNIDIAALAGRFYPSNTLSLLLGNGDGTFLVGPSLAISNAVTAMAVGDFNGDGQPDILLANGPGRTTNTLSVLLNQTRTPLTISQGTNGVQLAWPSFASGFALETTTNLPPLDQWTPITNPPTVIGNQRVITETPADSRRFYRLRQPWIP